MGQQACMTHVPNAPSGMSMLRIVVLLALCQGCSYTAATVGHGPCTKVLPALDATYAGATAAFGIAVLTISRDRPDHDLQARSDGCRGPT